MTKQARIALFIIALLIAVPVIWWGISNFSNQTKDGVIKDRDTGELLDTSDDGPQTGGDIAKRSDIVLFGVENLAKVAREKNGKTGRYLLAVQDALWSYAEKRLEKKFPTLTIRPQSLSVNQTQITGDVRIGQTDTIVPFRADITPNNEAAIVIINKDGTEYGGSFIFVGGIANEEEYLFKITQDNDKSTDLVVQSYGGYKEAAMKYLTSLGYNVPDFSIKFINYESVF